jgi:hypothetical protein
LACFIRSEGQGLLLLVAGGQGPGTIYAPLETAFLPGWGGLFVNGEYDSFVVRYP